MGNRYAREIEDRLWTDLQRAERLRSQNVAVLRDECGAVAETGDAADACIRMIEAETAAFVARIETEEAARISKAREALARGTYGTCEDCGEKISGKRLDAFHGAVVTCVDCQAEREAARRIGA